MGCDENEESVFSSVAPCIVARMHLERVRGSSVDAGRVACCCSDYCGLVDVEGGC